MELQALIELVQSVPLFIWIVLFIAILFLFGDKQLWEYEADFMYKPGIGRGEIEIEYYKKAKGSIDIELELDEEYQNKPLDIYLDGISILNIPPQKNNGHKFRIHEPYKHLEPHEGMTVEIKHNNKVILASSLLMD